LLNLFPDLEIASHDPDAESIPCCFERIAAAYPDNLAVGGTDWRPTFGELNVVANRVAHAILRSGAASGDRVAILMGQSAALVAAIMSVLKAACVVVVFTSTDPPARLRQVADDAEPAIIIADTTHIGIAREISRNAKVLHFEDLAREGPSHDPAPEISADQLALIVYTSGSTGQPNGVMHTHGECIAQARMSGHMMDVCQTDRLLFLASAGGYLGFSTVIVGLLSGASLWPFPALEKGVHGLADYLTESAITVCPWSPSILRHLAMTIGPDRHFPAVRCVRVATESATREDFRTVERHFSHQCTFINSLASSETGQIACLTLRVGDEVADGPLPIGRPHDGVTVELLDEGGRPVEHGEPGELVVTSRSVTAGYWRNPQLTSERCSASVNAHHRTLRTGDLVRWNGAGVLEFVGRLQRRYKVRGNRIELLEVERALRKVSGVNAATCSVFDLPMREPQLVAFVVQKQLSKTGGVLQPAALRRQLQALLPRQMIPSTFLAVDEIPLTANGKVHPHRLREMYDARERNNSDRPATDTEVALARIWGGVLGFDDIGRQDDFFDLGGDSLTASVTTAWLQAETGVQIDLGTFITHPTLEAMAILVDSLRSDAACRVAEPASAAAKEPAPLSFMQQYYWDNSKTVEAAARQTGVGYLRLIGKLNRDVLHECLQQLHRRHEMLRTSFRVVNGQPVQIIEPPSTVPLPLFDVATDADPVCSAQALLERSRSHVFDLQRLPLVMFSLVRLSEREHWLTLTSHHIIVDAWSWRIFVRELAESYEARIAGVEDSLPAPQQFADFARWQRAEFRPDAPAYKDALVDLIDEHVRGAYPGHTAYRKLLLWCIRRSYPRPSIRSKLIGLVLRLVFALPPPPGKLLPFRHRSLVSGVDPKEGFIGWCFPPGVAERLDRIGRDEGATRTTIYAAICVLLVADAVGSSAIAVGSPFTNRNQPQARNVFGLCANFMTFVVDCDQGLTFRHFVRIVGERIHGLQWRSSFPYEALQRMMRAWKIKPLRNVVQVGVGTAAAPIRIRDLEVVHVSDGIDVPAANLDFKFARANDTRDNVLAFNVEVYDPAAMRDFADRLARLFEVAAENPDLKLSELLAMSRRAAR
jgi:amino acid adenylation domain-containing protein